MTIELNNWYTNTINGKKCLIAGYTKEHVYFDYRDYGGSIHSCSQEVFKKYFTPITKNN